MTSSMFNRLFSASPKLVNIRQISVSVSLYPRGGNVFKETASKPFIDKEEEKVLKVAVIGVPNSGKSTLINQIMSRRVFAVSKKVHTTTKKSKAFCTDDKTQLIFLDTPGLVSLFETKKHNLPANFWTDCESSLQEADLLAVVHDSSNKFTRDAIDKKVIKMLNIVSEKPSILVLNKVDLMKSKRKLLDLTEVLTNGTLRSIERPFTFSKIGPLDPNKLKEDTKTEVGWSNFSEVFMVSALDGSGVGDIKEYMLSLAKPAPWSVTKDYFTDQSPQEIVESAVREKLLEYLPQEIPYNIKPELEFWEESEQSGMLHIVVNVNCSVARYSSLLLKKSGARIRAVAKDAEQALANTFRRPIKLRVVVKVGNEEKRRKL